MSRKMAATLCACALAATLAMATGCANSPVQSSSSATNDDSSTATSSQAIENSQASFGQSAAGSDVPKSRLAQQIESDIKPIVKKAGMDVGVCVVDLESGERISINGDKRMVAASMIKLIVAVAFLEAVEQGKFSLNDKYTIKEKDIVGGTGSLGGRGEGAKVSYSTLVEKMIAESDNTAANILINAVGKKAVNETAKRLGLDQTKLNRLMMDEDAIEEGVENYVSANDIATILQLAYQRELISKKASLAILSALSKQTDDTGILAGLPKNTSFSHKTGSLADAQHDGGIVMGEDARDFVIVVLCGGKGFAQDDALDAMEDIGHAVYRDFKKDSAS